MSHDPTEVRAPTAAEVAAIDRLATALLARTPTSPGMESGAAAAVAAAKDAVVLELGGGRPWDDARQDGLVRKLLGAFDPWAAAPPPPKGRKDPMAALLAIRVTRLAHDAVMGLNVPDEDLDVLSEVGAPRPPRVPRAEADPDRDVHAFEVALPWRRSARTPFGILRLTAGVIRTHAGDAPVVAWLATPGAGRIGLRRSEGTYLRPVLSPGSWRPADVATFAAAAARGSPWRDDPFLPAPNPAPAVVGAHALCTPRIAPTEADGADVERIGVELGGKTSRMRVIDGVVHVPCGAPEATVLLRSSRDRDGRVTRRWALTWSFDGGPHGAMDMATLPAARSTYSPPLVIRADARNVPSTMRWSPRFALADAGQVDAFLAAWDPTALDATYYGNHHASQQSQGWDAPPGHRPWEVIDPSAMPTDPGRPEALLRALHGIGTFSPPSKGRPRPSARDPLGMDGVRAALDAVARATAARDAEAEEDPDLADLVL